MSCELRVASCEGDGRDLRAPVGRRASARAGRPCRGNASRRARGFTLIECLAAMLLVAIVLPAVMGAISLATRAASTAKARTEASTLASGKLAELVATDGWENGNLSGDFSPDWPRYKWQATVSDWVDADNTGVTLSQIDLVVTWQGSTKEESITLSTLARSSLNQ